jgi:hypothetical protein
VSDDLRRTVAVEHGLSLEAAQFLTGSTLAELEASAVALARMIEERREPESASATDFFAGAARAKAERKQAVLDAVTGRAPRPQPRDERGRYTGFDGGARQTVAPRRQSHEEWLADVLRHRRADVGVQL